MNELSEQQLIQALRRAGDGDTIDDERRASIRNTVLSEYDRFEAAEWEFEPLSLDINDATGSRQRSSKRWLLVAAASVLTLVAGLGFIVTTNSGDTPFVDQPTSSTLPPTEPTPAESETATTAELMLGEEVPEGHYVLEGPAEVSFFVPGGLRLAALEEGSIRFALADDDATLTVSAIPNLTRFDEVLAEAELTGMIRIERAAGALAQQPYIRRDLTLTPEAVEDHDCPSSGMCDVLGAIDPAFNTLALRSGAENYLSPIPLAGGRGAVVLEQFAVYGAPTSEVAATIISSIESPNS
ncbi:MAG: hypothetical protein AAGA42_14585 [Actinomycetota bacterium]